MMPSGKHRVFPVNIRDQIKKTYFMISLTDSY